MEAMDISEVGRINLMDCFATQACMLFVIGENLYGKFVVTDAFSRFVIHLGFNHLEEVLLGT